MPDKNNHHSVIGYEGKLYWKTTEILAVYCCWAVQWVTETFDNGTSSLRDRFLRIEYFDQEYSENAALIFKI